MPLSDQTLIALCALLALELALLRRGQRRLFWTAAQATRSRILAYALAAPGTALHEAAHYLACLALGVPITGRVRLFWPQRTASGDIVLGSVPHARTGALRQALISIAPLVLVPAALTLATAVLLAPHTLGQLPDAITQIAWWRAALLVYLSLSCAQAAFPSSGDHIGLLGGVCLGVLLAGATAAILTFGSQNALLEALAAAAGILALPAVAAAVSMLALGLLRSSAPARL